MKTSLHSCCQALVLLLCLWGLFSCEREQVVAVTTDFSYTVEENNYSIPVKVNLTNKTTGATNYKWTFENGQPATSTQKNPGTIVFPTAGQHRITLKAWNQDERQVKEIVLELDEAVQIDFDLEVQENDFAPVAVKVLNKTQGASTYSWTFEGGSPATSTATDPGLITFTTPGEHTITLQVANSRSHYTLSKKITVAPALAPDFDIIPENEDLEAPLKVSLQNKTISGTSYTWSAPGGQLTAPNAADTDVLFSQPGSYTVSLQASNGKETKTATRTITVKANSNLATHTDVKLGISAAHATLGSFYSTKLRQVLKKGEVTEANGSLVDLVYFGINSSFSYNKFVSPAEAQNWTFDAIPSATATVYVNSQELCNCGLNVTAEDFDSMRDDALLRGLRIVGSAEGDKQFTDAQVPRVVLFQTQDGRKGAIKIKRFVQEGSGSYVLLDVKVQKEATL